MTFNQKLIFLWQLPFTRKCWLLMCIVNSIACLLIIYLLPTKYLRYFLGDPISNRQACSLATPKQTRQSRQIASLMQTVANNVPWPCKCLAQALSVKWILNWLRIPSITYLGAKLTINNKDTQNDNQMKAHAWLSVGPTIVIGRSNEEYTIVGSFTSLI